jgi:hypothetical protein
MQKETLKNIMLNNETFLLMSLEDYTKEELNEYFNEGNDFPLLYAIKTSHAKYFLFNNLILPKLDLNLTDTDGKTSLMWAASFGLEKEVKIMIENGADWTVKDNEGKIALDYAKEYEKWFEAYEYEAEAEEDIKNETTYIAEVLKNAEVYLKNNKPE